MITLPMLFLKPVFRGEVVFPAACHEQKVECKSSYLGYCREKKDLCCGREWIICTADAYLDYRTRVMVRILLLFYIPFRKMLGSFSW